MNEELTVQGASIEGTSESDSFTLRASNITLSSGAGDDSIEVYAEGNVVDAGAGDNEIIFLADNNTLMAGDGDNDVALANENARVTLGDGDNTIAPLASNITLRAGNGDNRVVYNTSDSVIRLGNGNNTVRALYYNADEDIRPYPDDNDRNRIVTGSGADMIYALADDNTINAGAGDDTLMVEGNANVIYGGYRSTVAATLDAAGGDDVMTVRGDDNTIFGGAGENMLTVEGRHNQYEGSGNDTIRAAVDFSTLLGGADVEIEGDDNIVSMTGGRLAANGNRLEGYITDGVATVTGDGAILSTQNTRATVSGNELYVGSTKSTIETSTVTSGDFYMNGEMVLNGRRRTGNAMLHMTNGEITSADAASYMFAGMSTTLEGFEGITLWMIDTLMVDGVTFDVFTVPSGTQVDRVILVKDNEITGLGLGEGLKISEPGTYTVNGSAFELTPDDTLVGESDWAGLMLENTVDNIPFEGTSFNDNIDNYGAGVTVDSGIGEDHILLGSAAREFVAFDADSSFEVEEFATGFDSVSDVIINEGDIRDFRFDFGITGVHITQKDAALDLINSGYQSVDFLLQNGDDLIEFTALNSGETTAATGADFYALNDSATLYAGDEPFVVNGVALPEEYLNGSTVIGGTRQFDYEFAELILNSPLVGTYTVHGVSYDSVIDSVDASGQFFVFDGDATVNNYTGDGFFNALHVATDGKVTVEIVEGAPINNAYKSVKSITGIGAGDRLTVGSVINGAYVDEIYTVSADGTEIINVENPSEVLWSGDDLSTVNLMDIYDEDVFKTRLRDLLEPLLYANVTASDQTLRINLKGFRDAISARLDEFTEKLKALDNPTAADVMSVLDGYLSENFGLVLSDVFNATTIDNLKTRLAERMTAGVDIVEQLFEVIETEGVSRFVHLNVTDPLYTYLGMQASGDEMTAFVKGKHSLAEQFLLDFVLPNVAANDRALRLADAIYYDLKDSFRSNLTAATNSDGHVELIFEGTRDTLNVGVYVDNGAGVMDASTMTGAAWIFNGDGGSTSIVGSAQRDLIMAGAGDTIDAGAGVDDYIVLASGESSVFVNADVPTTLGGIVAVFDAYVEGTAFEDAHTREYVGLSSASSIKTFGFETGFDGTTDVIMVDGDVDDLQFAFNEYNDVDVRNGAGVMRLISTPSMDGGAITSTSRTPNSDVSVDVMLRADDELIKATAINGGHSIAATGADHYYVDNDATLTNFSGSAVINDVKLETGGALNVAGSTVEGADGVELAVTYVGGLTAGDTLSIGLTDGSDAINYSVSADGTSIVRTDKNAVVWSGAASELAALNVFAIDDQQYTFDEIEENLSTALGRDVNLIVSVVDGESIIGSTGDDAIFVGANDTVNGNGGDDLIWLTPSTIAPDLDGFADGAGARQYVDMRGAGNATVYGFEAGTVAASDVIFADDPYTLRAERDGIVIEDGNGRVLLMGLDFEDQIMVGDTIATVGGDDTTAGIDGEDTTSTAPSEDTTSTAPSEDTTSTAPSEDTTSTAPVDDTTSTEVVDSSTFIDNSADDINVTLTGAKVGVIGEDATGDKVLTAGDRATTLENHSAAANATLVGSARNDSIVAAGADTSIDISNGGRDTLDIQSGNVDVVGYDVTTKAAFAVDGVLEFNGEGFAGDGWSVKLNGEAPRGVFAAFLDEEGNRQLYGWNEDGSVLDGSAYAQPQHLISEGWSTIKGGSKDDIINATGGDIIQLSSGHDLITIDDRAAGEVTIDLGTHLSHSTVTGFDSDDIVKVDDVSALKVKETDDGLMLRAGKAHLTLAGVEDTVRIIDDDLFIFNGGSDIAINGFDDRWQLQAGDGIEVERVTTLVNGTVKFTSNGGSIKLRK